MNAFAGSGQHASRRRRRLAADDMELLAEFGGDVNCSDADTEDAEASLCAVPSDELLPRLVPRKLWKHSLLLISAVCAAVCAVLLERAFAANFVATAEATPHLRDGLSGIFLLVSGQLAMLIGWIRSRSAVDFNGRYRWWTWLSILLMAAGVVVLTNIQHTLPVLVAEAAKPLIGGVTAARGTLVLVPLLAIGSLVIGRTVPDMSRCRWSQAFVCLGIFLCLAKYALRSSTMSLPVSQDMLTTLMLASATSVLSGMLLHVRFVLYVSNDPPAPAAKPEVKPDAAVGTETETQPAAQTHTAAKPEPAAQEATATVVPEIAAKPKLAEPKPAATTKPAAAVPPAASSSTANAKTLVKPAEPSKPAVAPKSAPAAVAQETHPQPKQTRKSKKKRRRVA